MQLSFGKVKTLTVSYIHSGISEKVGKWKSKIKVKQNSLLHGKVWQKKYRMVTIFRGFKFSFLEGKSKFSWYLFSLHALSLASDRIASYPAVAVVSLLFSCYHTSTKV